MKHPVPSDVLSNRPHWSTASTQMKEIDDIIKACESATAGGQKTALATVVHVEGSSYRRPGARMLVTDTGALTGAISGGCLEGDALRKALLAIHEGRNKLVTYDTRNEDDARFGVQLGCNGIIHILFEPINQLEGHNPVALLKKAATNRIPSVVVTLFSLAGKDQPGTSYLLNEGESLRNPAAGGSSLPPQLAADARLALSTKESLVRQYSDELTAFIEVLEPRLSLIIFGAGNDALPLARISGVLGWHTTIVDGRYTHANAQRFPDVQRICVSKAESVFEELRVDDRTALVLMTHNYNYDLNVLKQLSSMNCAYAGILGPRKKFMRMTEDLETAGCQLPRQLLDNLYSPVGLDIGAETAEEIALSIAAEIKAVFSSSNARFLRDKNAPIHDRRHKLEVS